MGIGMRSAQSWTRRWALAFAVVSAFAVPVPVLAFRGSDSAAVEVRRTTDGIPHVLSTTWRGLGLGYGYAQAQDALCTLAEAFVTVGGHRSFFFGAEGQPETVSTWGKSTNLELDFFFQAFADSKTVEALRRAQPSELNELIGGYAEGYNRYVQEQSRGKNDAVSPHACRSAAWVRTIEPADVYRRMIAASLAGGYTRFIPAIVNARPSSIAAALPAPEDKMSLRSWLEIPIGESPVLGSNMLAFGAKATGGRGSVLFGNPHWYWRGPDRFYQVHLTLPGQIDVAGASFLGIPVVMIGFNRDVAWSHTVSAARRFGLFELTLDPSDPRRYVVDGVSEPMQASPLSVVARRSDGTIEVVRRTLYRTRFGPVVDLSRHDAALGWGAQRALAMRDVNAENFRAFRNFFGWARAKSLDEFMAIQRREAGMPWVNTVAIGRGDGRAWYADVGAVPDVPDDLRTTCATPLSKAFAALDPRTPLLDGSRSACNWKTDPAAAQPGAMPAARMPSLLRDDYVANMNDSYWLSNPAQPLEGYPSVLGGERGPLSLRGREGHRIAEELVSSGATSPKKLAEHLMRSALGARVYSADQFKPVLLDGACAADSVVLGAEVANSTGTGSASARQARTVDVRQACLVLRDWSNRADAGARGALLWDAFWLRLQKIPATELYSVPFSVEAPLQTPRAPKATDVRVAQALAGAVEDLAAKGWAVDMPLGDQRVVLSAGRRLPLFGGCIDGHFTVVCAMDGGEVMGKSALGNSYLQVVHFDEHGVVAHTLLAHGERETAVDNGPGLAPVARYARKDWLRFPFREHEIARDPRLTRLVLRP